MAPVYPDYGRPVCQRLERPVRNRRRSRSGYHSSGMIRARPIFHPLILSLQIALFVIGAAGSLSHLSIITGSHEWILGFGRRVTWTTDLVVPPGHEMTFKDALHILSTNLIMKIILPEWTQNLTKHNRKIQQSFVELKVRYYERW